MRRSAIIALAVLSAACSSNQLFVGERNVSFTTPASPDTLLARAAAALADLGFTVGGREGNMLFTTPAPLPESVAGSTAGDPQQWFIHVAAESQQFTTGSTGTLRAYLVPPTELPSPGNSSVENAHQVTADRAAVFGELRRVADRVRVAATRGLLR